MNAFSWVIYKSGIIGKCQFSDNIQVKGQLNNNLLFNRPFTIIPINLVTIKNGIYENGVSYKVIKAFHLELSPLIKGRFKNTTDNIKFERAIYLKYISIIYNMIYYNKPP
jgi:hypothetical protein